MHTVQSLKETIQAQISPGSDSEFLRILQDADTRLLESGRYLWGRKTITVTPSDGIITLDSLYASILGARISGSPIPIQMMDYEFTPDGPGEIEVGEGMGMRLIDQGFDDDEVRTYKVVGHDPTDLELDLIVHKAPRALYDPDISDSDIPAGATTNLICPDMGAIKLASLAIVYEENSDPGNSAYYMKLAYKRLDDREQSRRGNAVQQPSFRPAGRGIRAIRTFR